VKTSKCEKCGKDKFLKSLEVTHSFEDTSDDEYPQWVVQSVKIEGTPVVADVCLECGNVNFSVDPKPLRMKLETNRNELLTKQQQFAEEVKVKNQYLELNSKITKMVEESKKLQKVEELSWSNEKQKQYTELNNQLLKKETEIKEFETKRSTLLDQQKKKQNTLKELGLSSDNNPELIQKLVSEYENLQSNLLKLESNRTELKKLLSELQLTRFSPSKALSTLTESIESLQMEAQVMKNKYGHNFFN
jgi:chromosome segregation ATPase